MGNWKLSVMGDEDLTFSTVEALESLLLNILADSTACGGSIIDLESPSGKVMSFGVVGNRACVNFMHDPEEPPYFTVVGDPTLTDTDGVVAFRYGGDESEILLRNCIRPEQVPPLVREFFETDAQPTSIEWEEV
jgi:hypothetical protein